MWFIELNGADGVPTDGNRVGRITLDGEVEEFPMPTRTGSPINIAVGPDRNVWYTKGGALGRVLPDGSIEEFSCGAGALVVGLTAGADRQPPDRLVNRLYFADAGHDRIGFFSFS